MPTYIEVAFTADEITAGLAHTKRRNDQAKRAARKGAYGVSADPTKGLALDEIGMLGELAFRKFAGIHDDDPVGAFRALDVGVWQVRTAAHHRHSLILHPEDDDNDPFVLVTGTRPGPWRIQGWLFAYYGKQEQWWKDPGTGRPAFFVPQSALQPVTRADLASIAYDAGLVMR